MKAASGNIYYLCPDTNKPIGGVQVIYEHVDILNDNGYSASVLHEKRGFRCDWFENFTAISYLKSSNFGAKDFIVIPETYAVYFAVSTKSKKKSKIFWSVYKSPCHKVIFNQHSYNTFRGHSFAKDEVKTIYRETEVVAVMAVSEDNKQYLNYAFPDLKIFRVRNSIDSRLFQYQSEKKKQICFLPKKNPDEFIQLFNILKQRSALRDWKLVPIENKPLTQVAAIMRESMIFINLVYQEGFGLPSAEAMACGCTVIGYHGMGGKEFYRSEFCFPVETGDIIEVARTVEEVLELYKKRPRYLQDRALKASEFIRNNYSPEIQKRDVLEFWTIISG